MPRATDEPRFVLVWNAIWILAITIIVFPVFLYGIVKWVQFRHHFVITNRFPWVSNAIITILGVQFIISASRKLSHYANREPVLLDMITRTFAIGQATAFLISGLIIYRVILVYLRWKKTQLKIQQVLRTPTATLKYRNSNTMESNTLSVIELPIDQTVIELPVISNMPSDSPVSVVSVSLPSLTTRNLWEHVPSNRYRKVYKHIVAVIWLIYITVGFIWILLCKVIASPRILVYSFTWIMLISSGIIIIVFVTCKKVKEGIGCLKEAYITLSYLCLTFPLLVLSPDNVIGICFQSSLEITLSPIQSLSMICISLYYIYQSEDTLNFKKWQDLHICEIYKSVKSTDNVLTIDNVVKSTNHSPSQPSNPIKEDLNLNCFQFLKKHENYKIFAKYLGHCFALENLLFVEKVSVLFCVLNDTQTGQQTTDNKIRRIKFLYKKEHYKYYKNKLKKCNISNEKKILFKIFQEIYFEFIKPGSDNEINLSYETRSELTLLFDSAQNIEKFKNWDDLFDNSLVEIYRLLISMYQYKFRQYVEQELL